MLAILRQFQAYRVQLPSRYRDDAIVQIFEQTVDISRLVDDHKWLALQYSIYCAQLMADLKNETETLADLTQRIEAALIMAEFLEHLYGRYLNETDQIARMHHDEVEYRKMLRGRGVTVDLLETTRSTSYSKEIHEYIASANRLRLFTLRIRRLLIVIAPVLNVDQYRHWMGWLEACTSPAVAYLAWLTLLPRLLKNLFLLGKHLTPITWWMSDEEISLDAGTRFSAQLELHWFELANDFVTVSVGLLNCFVLTGSASIHLGVALLAFDVVLATWRAHYELRRLQEIKKSYEEGTNADPAYLSYLEKRIYYEELRHGIAMINTILLLFAASLTIPIIAFNAVIPLIAAALAVLTTIANMIACQQIEHYKPDDKVVHIPHEPRELPQSPALTTLGLFAYPNLSGLNSTPKHILPESNAYPVQEGASVLMC